jgi:hypothetical protein
MTPFTVHRSPGRNLVVAVLALPFLLLGLDLLLLPKLWPQYVRRFDRLADVMKLSRITADGPEEPWGFVFLIAGSALLFWALRGLVFPRTVLASGDGTLAIGSLLGPGSGEMHVPLEEIDVLPGLLKESGTTAPALIVKATDPGRLPSRPWGAVWVGDSLVIRAGDWNLSPRRVAELVSGEAPTAGVFVDLDATPPVVTDLEFDPDDRGDENRAQQARSQLFVGGVAALAGVLLGAFMIIARLDDKFWFLMPGLMMALGAYLLIGGTRELQASK